METGPRYDRIGLGYARYRREDPHIFQRIRDSLGDARSTVNVGAGTGSYEPAECDVVAIEPSEVMVGQRLATSAPAVRGVASALPMRDKSVDAAMAVVSLHHWDDAQEQGVRELCRVARSRVVIVTYDARVSGQIWLMAEYLPEVAALDMTIFPAPEVIAGWMGPTARIETMLLHRDTPDWMLGSYWAHPERVLDADARAATSGFAQMPVDVVERVVAAVSRDLADGTWDARHGDLRQLEEYDVGLRLIVAELDQANAAPRG
jgi:SAM-dependent methyltransferase